MDINVCMRVCMYVCMYVYVCVFNVCMIMYVCSMYDDVCMAYVSNLSAIPLQFPIGVTPRKDNCDFSRSENSEEENMAR